MCCLRLRCLSVALALRPELRAADCFVPGGVWPDDRGVHINAHDGGVIFGLPVHFDGGRIRVTYPKRWSLPDFDRLPDMLTESEGQP